MTKSRLNRDSDRQHKLRRRVVATLFVAVAGMIGSSLTGVAWSQETISRVGILTFFSRGENPVWDWFLGVISRRLAGEGWIEGKNLAFEYRSADADPSQFRRAAAELVELDVDIIVAPSAPSLRAAYSATHTIPIVGLDYTSDLVAQGYVKSYGRPGGNVTGLFLDAPEFAGKWLELIREIVPKLSRIAVLWDPAPGVTHVQAIRSVAKELDIKLQVLKVYEPSDIDAAFSKFQKNTQAVVVLPSPMTYGQSPRISRLALEHRLPASSMAHDFAKVGGTLSYGPEPASAAERLAAIVAKVLNGSKPAQVPLERPTKWLLLVNVKTTEALGITIRDSILLRADEVIE